MFYFSSNYRKRDLEIGSCSWLQMLSKQGAVKLEGNLWQWRLEHCGGSIFWSASFDSITPPKNIDLDLWTRTNLTKKNHPINYSNKYRQKRQWKQGYAFFTAKCIFFMFLSILGWMWSACFHPDLPSRFFSNWLQLSVPLSISKQNLLFLSFLSNTGTKNP